MQKKIIAKSTFLVIVAALVVIWSISSYYVVANNNFSIFKPTTNSNPDKTNFGTNQVEEVINPPLGNNTNRPAWYAIFTYMVMNLPLEVTLVFSAEIVIGTASKLDPKKLSMQRLGIMFGSASAISVFSGIIQYFLVYPAIHDLPIHNKTYVDLITEEILPQYGGAPTFYSEGVDILLLIVSMILLLGLHFLAFKYIHGMKYVTSGISLAIPLIAYPLIWSGLTKQVTERAFYEKYSSMFILLLIFAVGYILMVFILFIWRLSLIGTAPKKVDIAPEQQYLE
ncbi:MAG TPA: hypothetical protein VMX55_03840 [candidate division Zixibacteria bacterium]|nr:hypothetical protein [candidate division Zixibacteria bacterium]